MLNNMMNAGTAFPLATNINWAHQEVNEPVVVFC